MIRKGSFVIVFDRFWSLDLGIDRFWPFLLLFLTDLNKLKDALATILVVASGWVITEGVANDNLFTQLEVDRKELHVDPSR